MSVYFSNKLSALKPYVPGEQPRDKKYIKLNTNESPYPPSPKVKEKLDGSAIDDLRLYSDPDLKALSEAIANCYGLDPKCVFCSNGSDEVLSFAFLAWGDRGVAFPKISYGFYPVFADLYNLKAYPAELNSDFTLDLTSFNQLAGLIVFANPNAPTGLAVPLADIKVLLENNPDSVILVDEAYVDFGGESAVSLLNDYKNLIIVRTFSKSRQLAGARLGYALASEALINDLNRIKFSFNPYNVNRLTTIAGIESINDTAWFKECVEKIIATRQRLKAVLKSLGFAMTDSLANFLFVSHPLLPGDELYQKLKGKGILVRHFNVPEIYDYSRITIGTDEETDALIKAIEAIIAEAKL